MPSAGVLKVDGEVGNKKMYDPRGYLKKAEEAMAEGEAAARRALRILMKTSIAPQRTAARVRHAVCSRCEMCISACMYGARIIDTENGRIIVEKGRLTTIDLEPHIRRHNEISRAMIRDEAY